MARFLLRLRRIGKTNATLGRTSPNDVYKQIVLDLKDAQALLNNDFVTPEGSVTQERVRPNKGAATALLARAYLYQQKWDSAEVEATALINDSRYKLEEDVNNVFVKNNAEAIWQIEPGATLQGPNTPDGRLFVGRILQFGTPNSQSPILLNDSLVNNFEPDDSRRINWIGSGIVAGAPFYYPFKYKLGTPSDPQNEYIVVLRLAEQYLIRAEAGAQQNNLDGALSDLNAIRNRANLPNSVAITKEDILMAIVKERRMELFTEYGHRWLDLKRNAIIDNIMAEATLQKGILAINRCTIPHPGTGNSNESKLNSE